MDRNLTMKEITQKIREELKSTGCKWSVTKDEFSMGASICVALMEAPFEALINYNRPYMQVNQYYMNDNENITPEAKEVLKKAAQAAGQYNWDNSEPETDYFDVNFYLHLQIGKYDKPFKKNEKSFKKAA